MSDTMICDFYTNVSSPAAGSLLFQNQFSNRLRCQSLQFQSGQGRLDVLPPELILQTAVFAAP